MKNLKTSIAGLVLVLISGAVMATGNLKVDVIPADKKKTLVHAVNSDKSKFEIDIKNEKGEIVYYKMTVKPETEYAKYYNFSALRSGIYTLTVKVDDELMESTLKIDHGQVELIKQKKEIQPYFTLNGNCLEVSWLNFAQEDSRLQIFDKKGLLFEKTLDRQFTVNTALDLSQLTRGEYTAVLITGNNYYEYSVKK